MFVRPCLTVLCLPTENGVFFFFFFFFKLKEYSVILATYFYGMNQKIHDYTGCSKCASTQIQMHR